MKIVPALENSFVKIVKLLPWLAKALAKVKFNIKDDESTKDNQRTDIDYRMRYVRPNVLSNC